MDRVIARIGAAASGTVALNMSQKIKAARTKFQDAVINGDTAVDADGFDGLDKALVGTSTEFNAGKVTDWTDFDTNARAEHKALDVIDEFLSLLDGAPTVILGNKKGLARVRAAVRRAGQYTKDPVEGLLGPNGRPITRETYGNVLLVDPGEKAGTNSPIIPVATRNRRNRVHDRTDRSLRLPCRARRVPRRVRRRRSDRAVVAAGLLHFRCGEEGRGGTRTRGRRSQGNEGRSGIPQHQGPVARPHHPIHL